MLEQPKFGQRLKALRVARGLSQAALAGDELSTGYLSRLESGARPPTERVLAHLVERLGVSATDFIEPEEDSLAQVLARVTSATETEETADLLSQAIESTSGPNPALHWQALWLLAGMRRRQGRHKQELSCLRELVDIGDELGLPELQARARTQTARCLRALGDNEQALACAAGAYGIAQRHGLSDHDTAHALLTLVSTEAEAGRLPDARSHAEDLMGHATAGTLRVEALWAAAGVRNRQGDRKAAQALLEKALEELDSHDDLTLWMRLRLAAASLCLQSTPPQTDAARRRLREAGVALNLVGTKTHQQEYRALEAHLAFHEDRLADATVLCEEFSEKDILLSFRDRVRLAVLRNRLLILSGQAEKGIHNLQLLAEEADSALNVDLAAEIWRTLAETLSGVRDTST